MTKNEKLSCVKAADEKGGLIGGILFVYPSLP